MRLPDLFVDVMAYALALKHCPPGAALPYDRVRSDVLRLLGRAETLAKEKSMAVGDFEAARFAACAFVDEAILNSPWEGKHLWQREALQRTFYGTAEGGVDFFERLNGLGPFQQEVREVYDLCLALGFLGRFCHKGDEHLLESLKEANLKILFNSPTGTPSLRGLEQTELFPGSHAAAAPAAALPAHKSARLSFTALLLAGPVLLFALLFVVFHQVLGSLGGAFLATLP